MKTLFLIIWVAAFCLLVDLGHWQLGRYHTKQDLLTAANLRLHEAPIPFGQMHTPLAFQRVELRGEYVNEATLLVQNQFQDHRVGVEVLTPFRLPGDSRWVLVDRGWVALPAMQALPVIEPIRGSQTLVGHIKFVGERQFILGDNIANPQARPLVVQKVDIKAVSGILNRDLYPFVVRLSESVAALTAIPPERHLGYAVQWFVMALVWLVMGVIFGRKIRRMS